MPHEPTALERHAAVAVTEAVDYLHRAQSLLDVAENAILEEERKHAPAVSPSNQAKLVLYAEVAAELDSLRARLAP